MRNLIALTALVLCTALYGQNSWQRLLGPHDQYIYGDMRTPDSGFVGNYYTNDGCLHWELIAGSGADYWFSSMFGISIGYTRLDIVTPDEIWEEPYYNICTDGGLSWRRMHVPSHPSSLGIPSRIDHEHGVFCVIHRLGFQGNSFLYPIGYLTKATSDTSWKFVEPTPNDARLEIRRASHLTQQVALVTTGQNGLLLLSFDSLKTWKIVQSEMTNGSSTVNIDQLRSLNDSSWLAIVYDNTYTKRHLCLTTDTAATWNQAIAADSVLDLSISYNDTIFVLLQDNGYSWIYRSVDAGQSWHASLVTRDRLHKLSAPSASTVYAFGDNGIIFKTTSGGGDGLTTLSNNTISTQEKNLRIQYGESQITIAFSPASEDRTLRVINLLGQTEQVIPVGELQESVQIESSGFPVGAYLITLGPQRAKLIISP